MYITPTLRLACAAPVHYHRVGAVGWDMLLGAFLPWQDAAKQNVVVPCLVIERIDLVVDLG